MQSEKATKPVFWQLLSSHEKKIYLSLHYITANDAYSIGVKQFLAHPTMPKFKRMLSEMQELIKDNPRLAKNILGKTMPLLSRLQEN